MKLILENTQNKQLFQTREVGNDIFVSHFSIFDKDTLETDSITLEFNNYFGITPEELEEEIEYYINQEINDVIDPVYKDKEGRYILIFDAPGGKRQKYYLQDYGYNLHGKLKVIQEKE